MKMSALTLFVFTLGLSHASAANHPTCGSIPFVNSIDYQTQLKVSRPDLWKANAKECANDIRVRSDLMTLILSNQQNVTEETGADGKNYIWVTPYPQNLRTSDLAWIKTHQDAILIEEQAIWSQLASEGFTVSPWLPKPGPDQGIWDSDPIPGDDREPARMALPKEFAIYPSFYPIKGYIGYQMGPRQVLWDNQTSSPNSVVYKIFFEFKDFSTDLTPQAFKAFAQALHASGYEGDAKISMTAGWGRSYQNLIIMHTPSLKMALTGEQVGLGFFGDMLSAHSRGVDFKGAGESPMTWVSFLCTRDATNLSMPVLNFINGL